MNRSKSFNAQHIIYTFLFILYQSITCGQINYYVADSGSNNNNGLSDVAPFLTINKAISMVNPGDTILVMNGTYRNVGYGTVDTSTNSNMNNQHVVTINKSGEEGAYITLKNYPNHSPKIEFDGKGGIQISNDMNYIIVEGFEVQGPAANITYSQAIADRNYKVQVAEDLDSLTNYNHSYFSGKGIWGGYGAHKHIIIRNNIVYNTCGSGIRFNDSDYITIEYNTVYNATWWTSSASSAIVFAETIAESGDNSIDVKMIMRGNVVYNNWNRIPFYKTQDPDNSGNTNPNYGAADYNDILDGQGLYVTRSDTNYNGTFLFENNICANNGKNGINFDNSLAASAIYQNNTLYFNGVHEIIQDNSVAAGNPAHRGQKVAGIKANKVKNATAINNIVVTRDNIFSALEFNNMSGSYNANNNIFLNGKLKNPNGETNEFDNTNIINSDPSFVSVPTIVNGAIDISQTNFNLMADSPAINAGDNNYAPLIDIDKNSRPVGIYQTSFENGIGDWVQFGSANLNISSNESASGGKSLMINSRTLNYSSPRLYLDNLLKLNQSYTFSVKVKLENGASGTSDITIRNDFNNQITFTNLLSNPITVNDQNWTQLTGNFTYTGSDEIFVYIKGPILNDGGGDFYIDDFSIVPQGLSSVDFSNANLTVDIGAYELISTTWTGNIDTDWSKSGNWTNGVVTSSIDATIPEVDNAPIINSTIGAQVHNLSINESDGITINSGGALIVNGTSSGHVKYNQNLQTENWYLVSSPVVDQTYNDAYINENEIASGQNNNKAIGSYQTDNDSWSYLQSGGSENFNSGTGYAVKRANGTGAGLIKFSGSLNTDNNGVNFILSNQGNRFNLVGNPYPSYLNSLTFLENESAISDTKTFWIWNQDLGENGDYEVKTIGQNFVIAPGQGFFVKSNTNGGTFNFSKSNQNISGGNFQKEENEDSFIRLTLKNKDIYNYCDIFYTSNMTSGFDLGFEGELFGGISNSFSIYSQLLNENDDKNYQIQSLPNTNFENMVIPIGVNAKSGIDIKIEALANNLPKDINIYLEDKENNTFTLLNSNSNFFTTLKNDLNGVGRFYLHTSKKTLSNTSNTFKDGFTIYTNSSLKQLIVSHKTEAIDNISIYDLQGKCILNKSLYENKNTRILNTSHIRKGIYLVKVASGIKMKLQKIIIY